MIGNVLTYDEAQAIRDTMIYEEKGVQKKRDDIIMPQEGFQEKMLSSPASFIIGGGNRGGGKTGALQLSVLNDYDNPRFNARLFRREKDDFKRGLWQETDVFYGDLGTKRESDYTWTFESGAELKFEQISDENKADRRFRGGGVPRILMDEINQFSEETIWTLIKSNRNAYGIHNSLIGTTNPDIDSWVYQLIQWYLSEDGTIDKERDGKIRYFYKYGKTHKEIFWGNSREEVYGKAKPYIDAYFSEENAGLVSKMNMIKSFQFIQGNVYENKILLTQDPDYISNIASGGAEVVNRELLGIWRKFEDESELISAPMMQDVFDNDPQVESTTRWIVVDVALEGGDMFIASVWSDWHLMDIVTINNISAPDLLANIQAIQRRYKIPNNFIIYDADGVGGFLGSKYSNRGFLPNAIPYHGGETPKQRTVFYNLNAEMVNELKIMIEDKRISIESSVLDKVITKTLPNGKLAYRKTINDILMSERKAYRWITEGGAIRGKCQLIKKKEMRRILGGSSPDFMDIFKMRCYANFKKQKSNKSLRGFY
jgi:Terminase-like family.